MKITGRKLIPASAAILAVCFACISEEEKMSATTEKVIREAHGSGHWFPSGKKQLDSMVGGFIDEAKVPAAPGRIVAAISPHAGFVFSGRTAGYTFRAIRNQAEAGDKPETVVVVGFTHGVSYNGVALMDGDTFRTPLGDTAIDMEAVGMMTNRGGSRVFVDYRPHGLEHSAENEIPFVQKALPDARLVVALIGDHDAKTMDGLVTALEFLAGKKKILVVASTDLLHNADYDLVTRTDKATLKKMEAMDVDGLAKTWSMSNQICCGIMPVLSAIKYAKGQGCKQGTMLFYRNNGDDDPSSRGNWVVGYGSVIFTTEKK